MIPPCSCAVPGMKPGTSMKVTRGMLKASQNLTNLAAFADASMSSTPAIWSGWLATMPTVRPSSLANPTRMLGANFSCTCINSPSSTTLPITVSMSYGSLGLSGITVASASSVRPGSSALRTLGRVLHVVLRQESEEPPELGEADLFRLE